MKKLLIILPLVLLVTAGCQTTNKPATTANNNASSTNNTNSPSATGQKFSESPDYQNSYLISGPTLSPEAQQVLNGFKLSKQTLADGSEQINLKAMESAYQDQQYTLQPGQQLFFVDRSLGDDSTKEGNSRDDYGIIVDGQGYIVTSGR